MSRPIQPRPITEHLIIVSRTLRSIEVDASLPARRKTRLLELLSQLVAELQKELKP